MDTAEVKQPLLKAPFPWFGGKSRVADLVWSRFGNVPNYVEPFFGSGAVLLARPHEPRIETVNDADAFLANFWRAVQADPEAVAYYADQPVNEADLHARHLWLVSSGAARVELLKTDPDYYDPKIAGWWVWGLSCWIGSGWCSAAGRKASGAVSQQLPHLSHGEKGVINKRPSLGKGGRGVNRQLPRLTAAGQGVNRQIPCMNSGRGVHRVQQQIPHLSDAGPGVARANLDNLLDYMEALADRLRKVRVCCGDWSRITGPAVTTSNGITGVFLDPPYNAERTEGLYLEDSFSVSTLVREWALENGNNRDLRIALCGYEGEHDIPSDWECVEWKARGGYDNQGTGRSTANRKRERIWFSPHCLKGAQPSLF